MGDPACHLTFVCLHCGRFLEARPAEGGECPHCGEPADGGVGSEGVEGQG